MSKCELEFYAVRGEPHHAFSMFRTVGQCTVHHWVIDSPIPSPGLCPIGRIEEATAAAIARIREER